MTLERMAEQCLHGSTTTRAMICCFILLTDPYSLEQRMRVYRDMGQAAVALENSASSLAEIRRVHTCHDVFEGHTSGPMHMIVTREDEGIRIHGIFTTVSEAETFLGGLFTESRCHHRIAWPVLDEDRESATLALRA
jgi:hypothetical protein